MNSSNMNSFKRIFIVLFTVLFLFSLTACNGGSSSGKRQGKQKVTFWAAVSSSNQNIMTSLVKTFNDTHDNVEVTLVPQSVGYSSSLSGTLRGSTPPDVVMIDDQYFKSYVKEGYLTKLDDYVAANNDKTFNLDDMWPSIVSRFCYDPETGYSGGGNNYYAIPNGSSPAVMYYNKTLFDSQSINVISVAEDELDGYNSENSSKFLPHGYYVYDTAPVAGLTARSDGKYYVFNNRIGMSWDELVSLSKIFTKAYNPSSSSSYGFLNEWWFSHGWSVGGDCLEWDSEKNQYIFSLGDETPNYLVTGSAAITVNGNEYKSGDLISYADKKYVTAHLNDSGISTYLKSQNLYKLPSIKDAFSEFCSLSQAKGKTVTANKFGYGISPSPTTLGNNSKSTYFTSGEVAMVCEATNAAQSIGETMNTLGKSWDVAPMYQYREFNSDGTLKTVNGTNIVGKKATHNNSSGYAIPSNSKNKSGAWEFIKYMAGTQGQSGLIKANSAVPNQKDMANSPDYLESYDNYAPHNKKALVDMTEISTVGDWSYVEDGQWINGWANILNTKVRDGNMTLDEFFSNPTILNTNQILKSYTSKKYNK